MDERSSPWSEVMSGIFAILTAIATYLGTQPVNTLFAVLLGATVTYSVQKRLQRETEKRSKNAEYVEKYYGPLLVEIEKIQETILTNVSENYNFAGLEDFKTRPQFYTMGTKLRTDFLAFANEIVKVAEKIGYYRGRAKELIREIGTPYLVNPPGKHWSFVSDPGYSPIYLRYCRESERFVATLDDCILRGRSLIDMIKDNVTDFQEEGLEVQFNLNVKYEKGGSGKDSDRKSFLDIKETLSEIVSKINAELGENGGYKDFQSKLSDLRQKAALLSSRLARYVEKYVSIVDV